MGESSIDRFPFGYNRSLEVDGSDESVSADAGALVMREILECSGIVSWLEDHLIDDRRPGSVVHSMGNLMRTCLLPALPGPPGPGRCRPSAPRPGPCCGSEVLWRPCPRRWKRWPGVPADAIALCGSVELRREPGCAEGGDPCEWLAPDPGGVPRVGGLPCGRCGRCAVPGGWASAGSQYCGYVGHRCYSALVAVSGEAGTFLAPGCAGRGRTRPERPSTLCCRLWRARSKRGTNARCWYAWMRAFPMGGRWMSLIP